MALGAVLLWCAGALAQTSTTGSLRGLVRDRDTGQPVVGATVVVSSPALQGSEAALTDERGVYLIGGLPPGEYQVTAFHGEASFQRGGVTVRLGQVTHVDLRVAAARDGEVIVVEGSPPLLDLGSTKAGVTITPDYTRNVPTGRSFGAQLEVAAGTQKDDYGSSFAGSTSLENSYVVDGLHVTDPLFGKLRLDLPNEFVQEAEVIAAGYDAESGRSTGGVVNVLTRSGSNEFHGSVYGYLVPRFLVGTQRRLYEEGNAIQYRDQLSFRSDVGAEVGGPIVRDRLWFHAGINPQFEATSTDRVVVRYLDTDGDGAPDLDGDGREISEELERRSLSRPARTVAYTAKLSFAASDDHRASLSLFGNPATLRDRNRVAVGADEVIFFDRQQGAQTVTARWQSRLAGGATHLDASLGYLHTQQDARPHFDTGDEPGVQYLYPRPLGDFEAFEAVPAGCATRAGEAASFVPCPVSNYLVGGLLDDENTSRRLAGAVVLRQRAELAGVHELKVGVDVERNWVQSLVRLDGGRQLVQFAPDDVWLSFRLQTPQASGALPCGSDIDGDGVPEASCEVLEDGLATRVASLNMAGFVQDSWSIRPELSLNLGLRWERQALGTAEHLQGLPHPADTGTIGDTAFTLPMLLSPRIGLIYDWTREGRSRLYGHWGRYHESVPLRPARRGAGGEMLHLSVLPPDACGAPSALVANPGCDGQVVLDQREITSGVELVAPGLGGQYVDELVLGADHELVANLKVGVSYVHRALGRAIEDLAPDGQTLVIANPGEVDRDAVASLRAEAAAAQAAGEVGLAAHLERKAALFEHVSDFDRPLRRYDAMVLSSAYRLGQRTLLMAAYTYSRLRGNHPGLYSPDTGQDDPNLTSMYDLPDLMANRHGALPHDRPHNFKIDGYHLLPVAGVGEFIVGGRYRMVSGRPLNTLGSHPVAGTGESFILPRGTAGRGPLQSAVDLHLGYGRALAHGMTLEGFLDIFNVFNQQPATLVDDNYTLENVNPIVDGDATDLAHLKAISATGSTSGRTAIKNRNFGNAIAAQEPISVRLGLRLRF
jgi:hypothetical protein